METMTTSKSITLSTVILQDLVSRAFKGSTLQNLIPLTELMNIEVNGSYLYVRTTDNVNYLTVIQGEINQPDFEVTIDSKLFSQLVSKLTAAETKLTIDENKLVVEAGGKYNIAVATENDGSAVKFPKPTLQPDANSAKQITNEQIRDILTLNKSCKSEMKEVPCLYNYYMDEKQVLTTNSFKACKNPISITDRPIVLTPNLVELIPCVADANGVVLEQNATDVKISSTKGQVIGKKAVGGDLERYPVESLESLFSLTVDKKAKMNRTMFLQALDRVGLFTDSDSHNKITLTFTGNKVTIFSDLTQSNEDLNYIENIKDAQGNDIEFEPVVLDMDALYLKNELTACSKENIVVGFGQDLGVIIECDKIQLALGEVGEDE